MSSGLINLFLLVVNRGRDCASAKSDQSLVVRHPHCKISIHVLALPKSSRS